MLAVYNTEHWTAGISTEYSFMLLIYPTVVHDLEKRKCACEAAVKTAIVSSMNPVLDCPTSYNNLLNINAIFELLKGLGDCVLRLKEPILMLLIQQKRVSTFKW